MSFEDKVRQISGLHAHYRPGFQALGSDSEYISTDAATRKTIEGSIDLDNACQARYPNEARWDYGIFQRGSAQSTEGSVHWIEVHPASGGSCVNEVIGKATWLKGWLQGEGSALREQRPRKFIWIATGRVALTQNSPQARRLAQAGVQFPCGHYRIQPVD